jgi:hypothetical protein
LLLQPLLEFEEGLPKIMEGLLLLLVVDPAALSNCPIIDFLIVKRFTESGGFVVRRN